MYFKRIPQFISCLCLFIYSMTAQAVSENWTGGYLGFMLGPGRASGSETQTIYSIVQKGRFYKTGTAKLDSKPFVSRIYAGYDFLDFLGAELGLAYVSTIQFKQLTGNPVCSDPEAKVAVFDLVAKAFIPFGPVVLFAKGGYAATYEQVSSAFLLPQSFIVKRPGHLPKLRFKCGKERWDHQYRPTISFGFSYAFTPNWVGDVAFTRIATKGVVKYVDYVAAGISYHFVERYCGQFLCD